MLLFISTILEAFGALLKGIAALIVIIILLAALYIARWHPQEPQPQVDWEPSACMYEGDGLCY